MSAGRHDDDGEIGGTLSEINITPLVDVMLVLLTIFMVASSVETIQAEQEKARLLKAYTLEGTSTVSEERMRELEDQLMDQEEMLARQRRLVSNLELKAEKCVTLEEELEDRSQNVPISLPKVKSEPVNLAEERKIVVVMTKELKFYIGDTLAADCSAPAAAPSAAPSAPPATAEGGAAAQAPEQDAAFLGCLKQIEDKLLLNKKLQDDKECYLKADREIPYGRVLALMAAIRKSGITKFGLVSEEDDQ
jgi:biopolymer transport protein ExbD